MIRDAIDRIEELVRAGDDVTYAPDSGDTGHYFVRLSDGTLHDYYAVRAPAASDHQSTDSLARRLGVDKERYPSATIDIYYSRERIHATLARHLDMPTGDTAEQRWRHALPLPLHPAFAEVQALTEARTFTQRNLITFLRSRLNGHVDEAVVEQFRNLKLKLEDGSDVIVGKGREGIDRRIQQQILQQAGSEIPSEIIVTVPVFDLDETRDELHDVTLLLDPVGNPDQGIGFEVTAVLNTLRVAHTNALERIVQNLTEHPAMLPTFEVFYGEPR